MLTTILYAHNFKCSFKIFFYIIFNYFQVLSVGDFLEYLQNGGRGCKMIGRTIIGEGTWRTHNNRGRKMERNGGPTIIGEGKWENKMEFCILPDGSFARSSCHEESVEITRRWIERRDRNRRLEILKKEKWGHVFNGVFRACSYCGIEEELFHMDQDR